MSLNSLHHYLQKDSTMETHQIKLAFNKTISMHFCNEKEEIKSKMCIKTFLNIIEKIKYKLSTSRIFLRTIMFSTLDFKYFIKERMCFSNTLCLYIISILNNLIVLPHIFFSSVLQCVINSNSRISGKNC